LWLPGYARSRWRARGRSAPTHAWVTVADHFEPLWKRPDDGTAMARVVRWRRAFPEIAARHQDSYGRPPCYAFFYPEEEYRPEFLDPLAEMTRAGCADVEVHLHHDADTSGQFVDRVSRFTEALATRHGLLRREDGRPRFAFIHGNWALDNARPDGRWCGLNNEITLLRDLGCYADFTMPAAPDPSQGGLVNQIYRVTDDPLRPRSFERGTVVEPGTPAVGDLTMIPGPLGLDWRDRPFYKPRLETGELAVYARPGRRRIRLWLDLAPRIGSHTFIKLFTHGAQERNSDVLLGGDLDALFAGLKAECDALGVSLGYLPPWGMWRVVEHLRQGLDPQAALRA
jgi:hypothetical protein